MQEVNLQWLTSFLYICRTMDKNVTYQIIDTITQLSEKAADIVSDGLDDSRKAFLLIRPYLGTYCGTEYKPSQTLDRTNLNYCKQYIKSCQDGYYCAMEFLDIDIDPIQEIAEALDAQGFEREADLVWEVVNSVDEIQKWANRQSKEEPEIPYNVIPRKKDSPAVEAMTEEEFLGMFDSSVKPNRAKMLLNHIREAATEKNPHTYFGVLAKKCITWFKISERDHAKLVRTFLSVSGLDPALAANVRGSRPGKKHTARADAVIAEITTSRARL